MKSQLFKSLFVVQKFIIIFLFTVKKFKKNCSSSLKKQENQLRLFAIPKASE
jgi:hypothetical protein